MTGLSDFTIQCRAIIRYCAMQASYKHLDSVKKAFGLFSDQEKSSNTFKDLMSVFPKSFTDYLLKDIFLTQKTLQDIYQCEVAGQLQGFAKIIEEYAQIYNRDNNATISMFESGPIAEYFKLIPKTANKKAFDKRRKYYEKLLQESIVANQVQPEQKKLEEQQQQIINSEIIQQQIEKHKINKIQKPFPKQYIHNKHQQQDEECKKDTKQAQNVEFIKSKKVEELLTGLDDLAKPYYIHAIDMLELNKNNLYQIQGKLRSDNKICPDYSIEKMGLNGAVKGTNNVYALKIGEAHSLDVKANIPFFTRIYYRYSDGEIEILDIGHW